MLRLWRTDKYIDKVPHSAIMYPSKESKALSQIKGKVRTLANVSIKKYMDELKNDDFADFADLFADYDSGYICDIISEIADSEVSIYTQAQVDFAMNHSDLAQEAIDEGLAPEPNGKDFREYVSSVGAVAWYMSNERTMYENLEECVLYSVLYNLKNEYGIEELTENQVSDIEALLEFDNNDRLEDVIEEAAKVLGLVENEDED